MAAGVVALAFFAAAHEADAQGSRREGRALEFRTDLPWARLDLEGDEDVGGVSPLRVPGPLEGDFWLVAGGPGVETQRGRVRIELDEAGSRIESHGTIPFRESVMRAVLFPGYPQLRYGDRGKSRLMMFAALAGVGGAIWAETKVRDSESAISDLESAIALSGVASERERLTRALQDEIEDQAYRKNRRNLLLGATGTVWGVSFLDAVAFRPGFDVSQADASSMTLALSRKTRLDAMLRSAVFPGLGQAYNGRRTKAALVALAGIGAGAHYLWRQSEYNEAVAEFEKARSRFESSVSVDERTRLLAEQEALFGDVEDRGFERDVGLGLLGGVWFLSLVDTALDFGGEWGGARVAGNFGISIEPSGAVCAQVAF
jgi:hypothetical protein